MDTTATTAIAAAIANDLRARTVDRVRCHGETYDDVAAYFQVESADVNSVVAAVVASREHLLDGVHGRGAPAVELVGLVAEQSIGAAQPGVYLRLQ